MFIKIATKELLQTHLTALIASRQKLKQLAKEHKNLNDEEMKFYYGQMQQIYTGLIETTKQYELLTNELVKKTQEQLDQYKGEENANKDCSKV